MLRRMFTCSECSRVLQACRLPLINGNVLEVHGAGIFGERTDEFIARVLLQHVGRPAGNAADGENQRIEIYRNAKDVIG